MSFHPKMAYGATFHKSTRKLPHTGRAVRVHAREPRRGSTRSCRTYPPEQRQSAVLPALYPRAGPAGLHHRERDAARRRAARQHAPPTSRTSCRTTRCSTRSRSASTSFSVCRTLSCALNGAERVTEETAQHAGHQARRDRRRPGRSRCSRSECLGACDRAPVVMVNDALARVPAAGETPAKLLDDLRARGEAARQRLSTT